MKTLIQLVLILLALYLCGLAGSFLAGVAGATAAVFLHAGPYAVTIIVRVFSVVFFCGFVVFAWAIYSRRQKRKSRQKNDAG